MKFSIEKPADANLCDNLSQTGQATEYKFG